MTPHPDNLDPLRDMLARVDAPPDAHAAPASAIAASAIARARRRQRLRRRAALATACGAAGLIVALTVPLLRARHADPQASQWVRSRPAPGPDVGQLRAEVAALRAQADRLQDELRDIRQRREAALAEPLAPSPGGGLIRAAFDEQRDRAAFALVTTADRCRDAGADPTLVAAGYQRAATAFPDTRWAAAARERLDHR